MEVYLDYAAATPVDSRVMTAMLPYFTERFFNPSVPYLLTLSATKIYGPKQIGCLWIRPGVKVAPLVLGGGQEMALRSGTENVPLMIGFAKAVELLRKFKIIML